MHVYRVYGLTLASELELSHIPPSHGEPQVRVRQVDLSSCFQERVQTNGPCYKGYLYSPEICRLMVRDGSEVCLDPIVPLDPLHLEHLILGPVMSIVLMQRGATVLHGSCVIVGEEAVGFLGSSGVGKSTLAYSLSSRGHKALCDDLMCLEMSDQGNFWVIPAYPRISLRHDPAALFSPRTSDLAPPVKAFYAVDDRFEPSRWPLSRIYFLHETDRIALVKSSPAHALVSLIHHSRPSPFFEDPATVAPLLGRYQRLVQTIPMYILTRTGSLSDLDQVLQLVEGHRPPDVEARRSPTLTLRA